MSRTEYKKEGMRAWAELAPRYHRRWGSDRRGPWGGAAAKTAECARIKRGDSVLDVACGTGISTRALSRAAGPSGFVLGVDSSRAALRIARRSAGRNCAFACADAEKLALGTEFDAVACQYALFFFPDAGRALRRMASCLKKGGRLAVTVHGSDTPYYTSILDAVCEQIPDYLPSGPLRLDRFGTRRALAEQLRSAGLSGVRVREFQFSHSPGTFGQYWSRYKRYASAAARAKLERLGRSGLLRVRRRAEENSAPYLKGGRLVFPWQVLVGTAR